MKRARLVLHPVRLRILQALAAGKDTATGLAERLDDVPRSSIYRHLRLLVDAQMVAVAQTQRVRGVDERLYELGPRAHLGADDVAGLGADEHLEMFSTYAMTLIQDFSGYLERSRSPDLGRDRVGYTETVLHLTDDEFDQLAQKLQAAVAPLQSGRPGPGRTARKLSIITFPVGPTGDPDPQLQSKDP